MNALALPRGIHDSAVDRIAGWIVGGRFAPGAALPTEPELGAELGVSRTVVREAIRALQAKGMLITRPRTGTRVRARDDWHLFDPAVVGWTLAGPIDTGMVEDLVEIRLALEPFAAGLAAKRRTADDLAAMAAALLAMADALGRGDKAGYTRADLGFHRAVVVASRNVFLVRALPMVAGLLDLSFQLSTWTIDRASASMPNHRAVHDAIAVGEAAGASAAMEAIIVDARDDIHDHLNRAHPRPNERRFP